MLRKHILTNPHAAQRVSEPDVKDISALATVFITSEARDHPIDQVFDFRRGPGGTRWIAAAEGEQTLLLAFDTPQTIRKIRVEIEEPNMGRTQVLCISLSENGADVSRTEPSGIHVQSPGHHVRA